MTTIKHYNTGWLGLVGSALLVLSAFCRADLSSPTGISEWAASQLPDAQGIAANRLSLLSWNGHEFRPVPFQIDEMAEADMLWFPGAKLDIVGQARFLDGRDRLLALSADAGSRAPKQAAPDQGRLLAELPLPEGDGVFYLALDHTGRSPRRYVDHDFDSGVTHTDTYRLEVNPENELDWNRLTLTSSEGDHPVADALFIRLSAGVLVSGARLGLDKSNLKPVEQFHKAGPIRTVVHSRVRVVMAGIPVMTLYMQTHRYPTHIEAHSYVELPALYRATLKSPQVRVALRGSHPTGAFVRTARGGELLARIDGRMEKDDRSLIERGLSTDASWIRFSTAGGTELVTELSVPEALRGIPLELVLSDAETGGTLLGYGMTGWPPQRRLRFTLGIFFSLQA